MKLTIITTGILAIGLAINVQAQTAPAPAPVTPPKSEVNQRQQNQRARIKQGQQSGELTNKEARNVKKDEKGIHQEVKSERQANGGKLTPAEKKEVNRQQNQESKKIYNKKHNGAAKPGAQ